MPLSEAPPETRYARSGELHIAYQMVGSGDIDVVYVPSWFSHVELQWEEPSMNRFLNRLASFSRVVTFDKLGTGLSDPVPLSQLPTLEQRMDDVRAVLDDAGLERAVVFGATQGGPLAALFAATYPERTTALILYNTAARIAEGDGYPYGRPRHLLEGVAERVERQWGRPESIELFSSETPVDDELRQWLARYQRMCVSPGAAAALIRMNFDMDIRHVLPAIRVPTLVVHRRDNPIVPAENGRYLADHIAGARYAEVPGTENLWFLGDTAAVLDEVEEFLTGAHHDFDADRVLATVLFTDIVDSTRRAAELGDRRWRETLDDHNALVRRQLDRFRGREVDTSGDGFLATFDGPARAIRCADAVLTGVRRVGLEVRAGLHTGECEVRGGTVGGIAVHIAARVMAQAQAGEILVSRTVKDLVAGSGIAFEDRGLHQLKGVPGEWRLYAVVREG